MWHDLALALGLILVLEGIAPFLDPGGFKRALTHASRMDDKTWRYIGLASMVVGVIVIEIVSNGW